MSDTKKTEQESTGIVIRKTKEVKSKYPAFVKWIAGIIAAILMAGIGFFGGIFGLDEAQQSKLKQVITSSAVYQEAIVDAPAAPVTETTEVKK